MLVADADGDPERERALARQLADHLVDGLIVSPLDPSDESLGRHRDDAPGGLGRRRAGRADGRRGAVRQPRGRVARARAPARARPPPRGRAHAEPPVDARPAVGARRRRGVRGARHRGHGRQLAALDRGRDRGRRRGARAASRARPRCSACRTRSPAASTRRPPPAGCSIPERPVGGRLRQPPDRQRRRAGADQRRVGHARGRAPPPARCSPPPSRAASARAPARRSGSRRRSSAAPRPPRSDDVKANARHLRHVRRRRCRCSRHDCTQGIDRAPRRGGRGVRRAGRGCSAQAELFVSPSGKDAWPGTERRRSRRWSVRSGPCGRRRRR